MGLFDFLKKGKLEHQVKEEDKTPPVVEIDGSKWLGRDFEFLIAGEIEISPEDFDDMMTPNSFHCIKTERDGWIYYQVGEDDFNYSFEPPGIQMVFNDSITFGKAKAIVDEIILNIIASGQIPELIVIDKSKLYRFE
ncbi:MAG: hypothetical protein JSU01_13750 [Bacteroidetes bacterium]|nr:hypothetical protein [Bacteroidota bacterium]